MMNFELLRIRIKTALESLPKDRVKFAEASGLCKTTVYQFINKRRKPDSETVVKLCRLINASPDEFSSKQQAIYSNLSTPEIVEELLATDKTLTDADRAILNKFFTYNYNFFISLNKEQM